MDINPARYPSWLRCIIVVTLILFAANLFFVLEPAVAFLTWVLINLQITENIYGVVGTLIASFAGAWFAFKFARMQRDKERIDNEIAAGNRALFTLSVMWNETKQHQKEVVEPCRGKVDAWLNLHVSQPLNERLSFDMKDLSFLMQSDPTVFQQMILEEERFRFAAYLIEEHRTLALTETWPRLESAGLRIGESRPQGEIEMILGAGMVQKLKVTTDAIITNFDRNEVSLREAFTNLRIALKKTYPDRKFIDFKFNG